jgi:hypothetical protein
MGKNSTERRSKAAAWAIILERGYSESFIEKVEKIDDLKAFGSPCRRWLASDSDLGIVTAPMRQGAINIRTAFVGRREDLPDAIAQISDYLADSVGVGKRISWAQGGVLAAETREIVRIALGTMPPPWAFN